LTIGLIGSGNMARALARGWGEPVLCTDSGSGRARELAKETGGEALESNAELARRADVIVLAHKPAQLDDIAREVRAPGKVVISLLARTSLEQLRAAYPDAEVVRVQPNTPVEVRKGVTILAAESEHPEAKALFERVGTVVVVPEKVLDAAAACSGVGPAYFALVAEAQVEAAIKHGVPGDIASVLVAETMAGSAELLKARDHDTLGMRRQVSSPGGTTIRGLHALERGGVRAAFSQAMDDVVAFR
jgi:pyrroline-5-carboxylate reductase